jgi:hypothetical protein
MGQKSFISDADTALASLIWNGIKNESQTKSMISSQDQISFSSPKAVQKTRKISNFLYNINEISARNMVPSAVFSGKNTPPTFFALHYLITPFAGNDKDDHELLEKIICILLETPIIAGLDENKSGFSMKIDSLSLGALSKLWIALGAPFRLSVSITVYPFEQPLDYPKQVTNETVKPQTPAVDIESFAQLYQTVLKTFTEQSNGWKKRNMFVKQWVFQDFTKITDMSVDEMLAALKSLGDKLEQHASTAQFIRPMNLLAGYYEHQLNELKGMQKMSRRQTKNIETIACWINEVKTLVETLGS